MNIAVIPVFPVMIVSVNKCSQFYSGGKNKSQKHNSAGMMAKFRFLLSLIAIVAMLTFLRDRIDHMMTDGCFVCNVDRY